MDYKISIIVPVYNTSKYLRKCLDSMINQTDKDIEVIVIDDGSTDASLSIINEYVEEHPDLFKLISRGNKGIGYTRNEGILKARGEYITFIDSDDSIHESFCEQMYKFAKKGNLDMVVCDYAEVNESGQELKKIVIKDFGVTNLRESPNLIFDINASPWNKLYRTDMIKDNGITFPEHVKYEDVAYVIGAISASVSVGKLNGFLVLYFIREGGESKTVDRRVLDIFPMFKMMKDTLMHYGMFPKIDEYYEWFCINRVMVYNLQQVYQKDKQLRIEFIDESYLYLNENFPNWKKNSQYLQNNSLIKRLLKSNKWLVKLYVALKGV